MQPQSEVSLQDAYEAARTRAARTTEALILAEAQIMSLTRERDTALARCEQLERELEDATAPAEAEDNEDRVQCWHTEPDSPCDWNVCRQKGGGEDATEDTDPVGYAAAVGQAD
jgi:hypothetical protein